MAERPDCPAIRDLLAEYATGVLGEDDRRRVRAHVADCPDCRRQLDEDRRVVDDLLALVPPVEPPEGFTAATLARMRPIPTPGTAPVPRSRGRVRRILVPAAAVIAALAVGAGAVLWTTADDRRLAESYRRTLQVADGKYFTARRFEGPSGPTGSRVFAYQGTPSWVFIVVRGAGATGVYQAHLITTRGEDHVLGDVAVTAGEGALGTTIPVDLPDVARITLTGTAGPPLVASFR